VNIMTSGLAVALLLTAGVPAPPQPAPASLPVRWTATLGLPDRAALQAALAKPPLGLRADDALDNHDGKGVNHPIRTCDAYQRALKAGWSAENNAQIATEGFFIKGCALPQLILAAKPSRVSYVGTLTLGASALDVLPPSVEALNYDEDGMKAAETKGQSLRQFDSTLKVEKAEGLRLVVANEDARYDLEIVGYGDFNNDGIEDLLLFQASYATQGTMHVYAPLILTRSTPSGVLHEIEVK